MRPRILFVDDEPNVRQGLRRMLHPWSDTWDIAFAANGEEALDLMQCLPFDVVITDILMPEKDGLETIQELRRHYPDVKIVAVSGGGQRGNLYFLDIAKKLGAHCTLQKPFTPSELIKTIQELLGYT